MIMHKHCNFVNFPFLFNSLQMLNPEEDVEEPIGLFYNLFPTQIIRDNQTIIVDLFK